MQALTAAHPVGGDRRIWASLRVVEQVAVNKKRVLRLLREHQLWVTPHSKLQAKRTPTRRTPRPPMPHEGWGRERTKVLIEGCGGGSLVLVLAG
jgi:hypothetical protein